MNPLALCAALLLLLTPGMGRLLAKPATGGTGLECVSDGSTRGSHHGDPSGNPHRRPDKGQHDCGYCPLLASLVPATCVQVSVRAASHASPRIPESSGAGLAWRHPSGLGSRGPPTTD